MVLLQTIAGGIVITVTTDQVEVIGHATVMDHHYHHHLDLTITTTKIGIVTDVLTIVIDQDIRPVDTKTIVITMTTMTEAVVGDHGTVPAVVDVTIEVRLVTGIGAVLVANEVEAGVRREVRNGVERKVAKRRVSVVQLVVLEAPEVIHRVRWMLESRTSRVRKSYRETGLLPVTCESVSICSAMYVYLRQFVGIGVSFRYLGDRVICYLYFLVRK